MRHTIRVNVTRNDIRYGRRASPSECPVARAIRRHRVVEEVSVSDRIYIQGEGDAEASRWNAVYLPPEVRAWIYRFDNARPVEPIRFDFELSR